MKIGDKVRFLSEVGGGIISGFQGNKIVLVQDEDGFEIPTPINDIVLVGNDDVAKAKIKSLEQTNEEQEDGKSKSISRQLRAAATRKRGWQHANSLLSLCPNKGSRT